MSGCSRSGTGTEPMAKRPDVCRLGFRQEVSVQAPSQPPMTAHVLNAMPMGPKLAQIINTIPAIQRRRVRPIIFAAH
jgi:hypothetical protein